MYLNLNFKDPEWSKAAICSLEEIAEASRGELERAAAELDFPRDVYRELGRRGYIGLLVDRQFGGEGLGVAEYCLVSEEVGRLGLVSPQTAIQGQQWILDWGTPAQQTRYLPGLCDGSVVFAEAISEPGVGSSFAAMQARAVRKGDDWVISGSKTHVNLGKEADLLIVYTQTEHGLAAFLVERDTPGLSATHSDPIGLRLIPTADVVFDDVEVGPDAVLGEAGAGLQTFLSTFNLSRLGNASELIGLARRALSQAIEYAQVRQVGEAVVTSFQGIQWTIADCHQAVMAASALRDHAANQIAAGRDHSFETTVAKNAAIDAAQKVAQECFALIGGHGLYRSEPYLNLLADIYVLRTAGGSREVLRNYAARRILGSSTLMGLK